MVETLVENHDEWETSQIFCSTFIFQVFRKFTLVSRGYNKTNMSHDTNMSPMHRAEMMGKEMKRNKTSKSAEDFHDEGGISNNQGFLFKIE